MVRCRCTQPKQTESGCGQWNGRWTRDCQRLKYGVYADTSTGNKNNLCFSVCLLLYYILDISFRLTSQYHTMFSTPILLSTTIFLPNITVLVCPFFINLLSQLLHSTPHTRAWLHTFSNRSFWPVSEASSLHLAGKPTSCPHAVAQQLSRCATLGT